MSEDETKSGLKFWIGALAFSILLLSVTFALLSTYLAEIKSNTLVAIARADVMSERINSLDMDLAFLHHHITEQKPVTSAADASAPAASAAPAAMDAAKAAAPGSAPVIEPPSLAPTPAPASAPMPLTPAKP